MVNPLLKGLVTQITYYTSLAPVIWKRKIMHHQQVISSINITSIWYLRPDKGHRYVCTDLITKWMFPQPIKSKSTGDVASVLHKLICSYCPQTKKKDNRSGVSIYEPGVSIYEPGA